MSMSEKTRNILLWVGTGLLLVALAILGLLDVTKKEQPQTETVVEQVADTTETVTVDTVTEVE